MAIIILNWEKVKEIREKYYNNFATIRYVDLAEEYGVNRGTIQFVIQNKNWKDEEWGKKIKELKEKREGKSKRAVIGEDGKKYKICSKCWEKKEIEEFNNDKYGSFGKTSRCRKCVNEYDKIYKKQEYVIERQKEQSKERWQREKYDSEKIARRKSEEYRKMANKAAKKHREKLLKREEIVSPEEKKCYVCDTIKEIKNFVKDKYSTDGYTYDCKECRGKRTKKYKKTERGRQVSREYDRKRNENPARRIDKNISRAILYSIKRKKGDSKWEHLSYTKKELMEHLESQFDDKMTWDNYGSYWHIDHKIPRSLFYYEKMEDEEFRKCWALENLQPLEAIENIKKKNKILEEYRELLPNIKNKEII